jgi:biopolymer transport protein ExbD
MSGVSLQGASGGGGRRGRGRKRRSRPNSFSLQITSLMDVLMIIVVFLLKSYGLSSMSIAQEEKLELPVSRSTEVFGEGIVLVIAQDRITIDSEPVLEFIPPEQQTAEGKPIPTFKLPEGSMDASGNVGSRGILPVYDVLKRKKEEYDLLASRAPNPEEAAKKWTGDLMVQADKSVNYELIRHVMYTAGMAGFKQFRLTVEKQPE